MLCRARQIFEKVGAAHRSRIAHGLSKMKRAGIELLQSNSTPARFGLTLLTG
jgi:hypothetical protein